MNGTTFLDGTLGSGGATIVATAESIIRNEIGYGDPYDHWATKAGVRVRKAYYAGQLLGKISAAAFATADWVVPLLLRKVIKAELRLHPITAAHLVLLVVEHEGVVTRDFKRSAIACFHRLATHGPEDRPWIGWGLGFRWMSKNGLYGSKVPFITHTPYVMGALLALLGAGEDGDRGDQEHKQTRAMFDGTWGFLQSLHVMHRDADSVALSYGPVVEPRIVVNANTYAAYAYALHATYGSAQVQQEARARVIDLCRWAVRQQRADGSWYYFADDLPGNIIDGFHSCIVLRNLNKTALLVPEAQPVVAEAIRLGWRFFEEVGFDSRKGLCRRFIRRDFRDPYIWDIYDQAEYLGLLIDFKEIEKATLFREHVTRQFHADGNWWCRIDILGRRWGKNFLRWGIVPFWYHSARLDRVLENSH